MIDEEVLDDDYVVIRVKAGDLDKIKSVLFDEYPIMDQRIVEIFKKNVLSKVESYNKAKAKKYSMLSRDIAKGILMDILLFMDLFFYVEGTPTDKLFEPLDDLYEALSALDEGHVHPAPRPGRGNRGRRSWCGRRTRRPATSASSCP